MRRADLGLIDVETRTRNVPTRASLSRLPLPEELVSELKKHMPEAIKERETYVTHHGEDGKPYRLPFDSESMGTRRYLTLLGPVISVLRRGRILVLDELESSIHPVLAYDIIRLFAKKEINEKGAQLLFTSHLTSLFSAGFDDTTRAPLLRRDQFRFTMKSVDGVAYIYPLTEFAPRKNEALERGYFSGRYGGIPVIQDDLYPSAPVSNHFRTEAD